jgi:hypothetical protein
MNNGKFITANPETFDFEQVCPNEGTGARGWCEAHEDSFAVTVEKYRRIGAEECLDGRPLSCPPESYPSCPLSNATLESVADVVVQCCTADESAK